ncbi:MAG TPA: GNAT family N-acetyltransferase [Candidatus Sulfotelmatobacter sp.]|nr:GNAT family N-acetyltransferase [Candidatus Sulfotelmatobacter sp.]
METEQLTLRPVRPADRDRVMEITRDVWGGRDYLPRAFEHWVGDAGASFQAAEVDGVVVGVQRMRPYAPGLVWYEGLRVASTHHRRGIARAMLASAIDEVREQGFREMRLATRDLPAIKLFESSGFNRLVELRWWRGKRVEGGEPARMPDAPEAKRLWPSIAQSPGIELYAGVNPDLNGARDLDADELGRLAGNGLLRLGPSGRALAAMRQPWARNLAVSLVAGRGAPLRELLLALRFEADADGSEHVTVNLPPGHPAEEDMHASGYDFDDVEANAYMYALKL